MCGSAHDEQQIKSSTQKDVQQTPWEFVPRFFQSGEMLDPSLSVRERGFVGVHKCLCVRACMRVCLCPRSPAAHTAGHTIDHLLDGFFYDYSMAPMWVQVRVLGLEASQCCLYFLLPLLTVQENYLNAISGPDPRDTLKRMSAAADAICDGDLVRGCVRVARGGDSLLALL